MAAEDTEEAAAAAGEAEAGVAVTFPARVHTKHPSISLTCLRRGLLSRDVIKMQSECC